jgi:hypothetical protein
MKTALAPREVTLSIGTMLVKPVTLENLVMAKRIPLTLVRKMEGVKRTTGGGFRIEDAVEMTDAINAVVMAAAVDPRVTETETADSIAVNDIPFEDRVAIFTEANRPAAAIAPFSGEPGAGGDIAPDGEGVRGAAE